MPSPLTPRLILSDIAAHFICAVHLSQDISEVNACEQVARDSAIESLLSYAPPAPLSLDCILPFPSLLFSSRISGSIFS